MMGLGTKDPGRLEKILHIIVQTIYIKDQRLTKRASDEYDTTFVPRQHAS